MDVQDRGHSVQGEGATLALLAGQAPPLVLACSGWEEEGATSAPGQPAAHL